MATKKAVEPREFWTDFRCPICYNDREPLLYTDCGHKLCKDCMNHMFKLTSGANPVIKCHACRKLLRRKDITPKSREETEIEEEINHRIRLKKEMNETQDDFDTLAEYHDFLEVFEDIIALQMKSDQRHVGERILDEYRKQKQERKKRKEKRELQALAASTNAVLDLSSVKYPAQIVVSRANTQLDVKNNPVHRRMMYQLGGYDVQRYENKGLTLLSEHLKDLSNKSGF